MPARRARYLGMVFQSFYLIPEIDALDNVLMAARIAGQVGPAQRDRARSLLTRVGLAERLEHIPAHLSGGERQRLKLAMHMSEKGGTYVLDEPTVGLHMADVERLIAVLHRLVDAGNTVVVVEHDLDVIAEADWIIDMGPEGGNAGGEVVAQGAPGQLTKTPAKSHTSQVLAEFLQGRLEDHATQASA